MELDDIAEELYSLAPEAFTSTRTAREKEAKAAGNTMLATRIRQLQKPDTSAWLANQLAREHPDEIGPLLALGAALREATANLSGEQLRELGKQQRQLVYTLVQQARDLARKAGRKVTDSTARELETTLHAALADGAAGDLLAGGRLTKGLESIGFTADGFDADPKPASPTASAKPRSIESAPSAAARRKAAELQLACDDEQRRTTEAAKAAEAHDRAAAAVEETAEAVAAAASEVERLRAELQSATDVLTATETARRAASSELTKADRFAAAAWRRAEAAKERRARLAD